MAEFDSDLDLRLRPIPNFTDSELVGSLTNIQEAIAILAGSTVVSEGTDTPDFAAVSALLTRLNTIRYITNALEFVAISDYLLIVTYDSADARLLMPDMWSCYGYEFVIKAYSLGVGFTLTVTGTGTQTVEGQLAGIELNPGDTVRLKSTSLGWLII